jgi:hypothetical protein
MKRYEYRRVRGGLEHADAGNFPGSGKACRQTTRPLVPVKHLPGMAPGGLSALPGGTPGTEAPGQSATRGRACARGHRMARWRQSGITPEGTELSDRVLALALAHADERKITGHHV